MYPNDSERLPVTIEMNRSGYAPPLYTPPQFSMEEDAEEARLPLSQYLWILRRYRWRILGFSIAVMILTLIVSARLIPVYEASVVIDVDRATPSDVVGQDSARNAYSDSEQFMATQMKTGRIGLCAASCRSAVWAPKA